MADPSGAIVPDPMIECLDCNKWIPLIEALPESDMGMPRCPIRIAPMTGVDLRTARRRFVFHRAPNPGRCGSHLL